MVNTNEKLQHFKVLPGDIPVLYLGQTQLEKFMIIAGVGAFTFHSKDSEAVADRLEKAIKMIRDNH